MKNRLLATLAGFAFVTVPAYAAEQKLVEVVTEATPIIRDLPENQWSTLFRKQVVATANDSLVISGFNQISTEDNEAFVATRLVVNGVDVSGEMPNTGKQPDDVGGNHHFGVFALGYYRAPTSGAFMVELQVKPRIVDRNRVVIVADPPWGALQSQGRLMVERYAAGGQFFLAETLRKTLGSQGEMFCCSNTLYKPFLSIQTNPGVDDLLVTSSNVVARHNASVANPRGFDGEQIASVFVKGDKPVSSYIGENTTSRNAMVSVFNQAVLKKADTENGQLSLWVGGAFQRGAYADNVLTNIQVSRFSKTEGVALQNVSALRVASRTLPANQRVEIARLTHGAALKFVRISAAVGVSSTVSRAGVCRFDIVNGFQTSSSLRSLGNGYRNTTARLELVTSKNAAESKIFVMCTNESNLSGGTVVQLDY